MSEQTIQNSIFSDDISILDKYTCLCLGATTIRDLMNTGKVKKVKVSKNISKKPDVLIINKNKEVVVFIEFKQPSELNSKSKIQKAITQEIDVAREVNAKIFIVTDGNKFIWLNPTTGNYIKDEDGNRIVRKINPKKNPKQIAEFIDLISLSINDKNDRILKIEDLDPTDLAKKIAKILTNVTFASAKKSLYTFVEMFLFKFLSDIDVLKDKNSFEYIYSLYSDKTSTNADVLAAYLDGPREQMKLLFPEGEDGTSIVNGQIFHVEKDLDGHYKEKNTNAYCFKNIMQEFYNYEKKHGKFINISKDFKSKLFENFMKNSTEKRGMGQFFTPLKIVKEMVDMVTITKGMRICDPASGVGKFLLEAASNMPFEIRNDKLIASVELIGLEKQMEDDIDGDITTILAKANALINFSNLFKENNSLEGIQCLSRELLNKIFYCSKSDLGTLEKIKENEYDLILANPPYYHNSNMSQRAYETGLYTTNGKGVEALFLEWIIKSLKYGGTANIVLPDGIFTNVGNKDLKEYLLDNCYIESIISLPVNSFFNTSKKTYILTIRKKDEDEVINGVDQKHSVFCYICKSIGETLDTYRFDTPDDNDLHEAVNKYNSYKNLQDKGVIQEPFKSWFENDGKLKLISIDHFSGEANWNIDNFWTEEEKIHLGFREADTIMTLEEFGDFVDELVNDINSYKEALECLK